MNHCLSSCVKVMTYEVYIKGEKIEVFRPHRLDLKQFVAVSFKWHLISFKHKLGFHSFCIAMFEHHVIMVAIKCFRSNFMTIPIECYTMI